MQFSLYQPPPPGMVRNRMPHLPLNSAVKVAAAAPYANNLPTKASGDAWTAHAVAALHLHVPSRNTRRAGTFRKLNVKSFNGGKYLWSNQKCPAKSSARAFTVYLYWIL